VDPLPMPEYLLSVEEQFPSPERRAWMAQLPSIVRELADRWELRLQPPYQPGGMCSWVAPARDAQGRELVLKVGWRHPESVHEPDGLRRWDGNGAVLLHDDHASDSTSALLLERCDPGTPLLHARPEDEQDLIVAGLLRRLWQAPTAGPFRPLQIMCDEWADEFETKLAATPRHPLDPGLSREAMRLFRELPRSADRAVLLCTDLHNQNILAAQREPWLVIDPKPYVGDPCYDALQHLYNCRDRMEQDPFALVRRFADLLELDPHRLRRWLFARCVQESIDSPWLCPVAQRLAPGR
jgi:streptomycin 6-kinase